MLVIDRGRISLDGTFDIVTYPNNAINATPGTMKV
jgi:hypothetical protein